jgi:hypothetical protein
MFGYVGRIAMNSSLRDKRTTLILLVVFGSVWGLIELSLGGFLHFIHFPFKGIVLGGIGMVLMASFVAVTSRPGLVPWLGSIAASCKLFDAVLFSISPACPAVINPATAIVLEALAFGMVAAVFLRRQGRGEKPFARTGCRVQ